MEGSPLALTYTVVSGRALPRFPLPWCALGRSSPRVRARDWEASHRRNARRATTSEPPYNPLAPTETRGRINSTGAALRAIRHAPTTLEDGRLFIKKKLKHELLRLMKITHPSAAGPPSLPRGLNSRSRAACADPQPSSYCPEKRRRQLECTHVSAGRIATCVCGKSPSAQL